MIKKRNILKLKRFTFLVLFSIVCAGYLTAQSSSAKYQILMDIAHKQRFWNDPSKMTGMDSNYIARVKYMTNEFLKNAASLNADLGYLSNEINSDKLANCDLLFIHVPSAQYTPKEIDAIKKYLQKGGSLFLVMDADYWSTLKQTNVNELIEPFGITFGNDSRKTAVGGLSKAGNITGRSLKIPYHGARLVNGGKAFCFNKQSEDEPFGVYQKLNGGGKLVVMGEAMVSLYMTSWQEVTDYQCSAFMHDVIKWLLY